MPVRWKNIEMPIGGADQYTDAPHVLPGKMRELENIRFRRPPTASKRYGFEPLPRDVLISAVATGTVEAGKRVLALDRELLVIDDRWLYSFGHETQKWIGRGDASQCHVERRPVWYDILQNVTDPDMAWNQDIAVICWGVTQGASPTPLNIVVIDTNTNTVVSTQALEFVHPRCFAVGNFIYIVDCMKDTGTGRDFSKIDVTSGSYTFPAVTNLAYAQSQGPMSDVCAWGATHWIIVYAVAATGFAEAKLHLAATDAVVATFTSGTWTPTRVVACAARGSYNGGGANHNVMLGGDQSGGNIYWASLDESFGGPNNDVAGAITTSAPRRLGVARIGAGNKYLFIVEQDDATYVVDTRYRTADAATGAQGTERLLRDLAPASKPFNHDGRAYAWMAYPSEGSLGTGPNGGDQETFYLFEFTDEDEATRDPPIWVATAARGIAKRQKKMSIGGESDTYMAHLPLVSEIATDVFECAQSIKIRFEFAKDNDDDLLMQSRAGADRLRADFATGRLHMAQPFAGGLFLAGGRPSWYDGNAVYESGFAWRPEVFQLATGGASGPFGAGSYLFAVVYEAEDRLGNIHRSAPSELVTLTLGGGPLGATITIDETLFSQRGGSAGWGGPMTSARAVVYRTKVGETEPLYRATEGQAGASCTRGTIIAMTDTSTESDAAIGDNEVLYTTGDVLDNAGVPPCKVVAVYQSRLWLGGLEDPQQIWFSQPRVFNEAPRFNEALALRMRFDVTALADMESQLAVFGEDDIQVIVGEGPPATGGLDIGFQILDVPSDVGCIEPRSVVVYRDGVLFQSRKGIYRLGRDMQVTHVGAPIKGLLDQLSVVTSVVVLPDRPEVVFGVRRPTGAVSRRLVWNYELDEWNLDVAPQPEESAVVAYSASAGEFRYTYVVPGGTVYPESTGYADYTIDGLTTPIVSKWLTPWFKLSTLQDWIRVRGVTLLGIRLGAAGVTVEVAFDYQETTWTETHTFTATEALAAVVNGRLQLEVRFARQKCQAVRIRVTETFDEVEIGVQDTTAGIELQSLVFTGGFEADGTFRNVSREKNRK